MDFLGIGPGELILVMIVAMIVLGPARLPEIGSSIGRALSEFRKASSAITEELNRELRPEAATQEPARALDPVILDPAQSAPDIVEEARAETTPLPQGFRRLSVRDDDESSRRTIGPPVTLLPEGEAEVARLEAELGVKRATSALEIKRLESELETRRLEAELAAKRQAALAAEGGVLPAPESESPAPVVDSEISGLAARPRRPRPARRSKAAGPSAEAEASANIPEVTSEATEPLERQDTLTHQ